MSNITLAEAQAWLECTKLSLTHLDTSMESQIAAQVLARVVSAYPTDVVTWVDATTTPRLIRSVIAMLYAGWFYDKTYSENPEENSYADRLREQANNLIESIIAGTTDLVEVETPSSLGRPVFFPTDASTAAKPTSDNPSDGPMSFLMGKVF